MPAPGSRSAPVAHSARPLSSRRPSADDDKVCQTSDSAPRSRRGRRFRARRATAAAMAVLLLTACSIAASRTARKAVRGVSAKQLAYVFQWRSTADATSSNVGSSTGTFGSNATEA